MSADKVTVPSFFVILCHFFIWVYSYIFWYNIFIFLLLFAHFKSWFHCIFLQHFQWPGWKAYLAECQVFCSYDTRKPAPLAAIMEPVNDPVTMGTATPPWAPTTPRRSLRECLCVCVCQRARQQTWVIKGVIAPVGDPRGTATLWTERPHWRCRSDTPYWTEVRTNAR